MEASLDLALNGVFSQQCIFSRWKQLWDGVEVPQAEEASGLGAWDFRGLNLMVSTGESLA